MAVRSLRTIDLIFLTGMILVLAGALAAWVRAWRQPAYLAEDFVQASTRILVGMAGLVWRLERNELDAREDLGLPEGLTLPGWAHAQGASAHDGLRRECRLLRLDLLMGADCVQDLASQAARRRCKSRPLDPALFANLRNIHAGRRSLIWRLRLACLQLAFLPALDCGARSTLQAGRQFVTLCAALSELLRMPAPEKCMP